LVKGKKNVPTWKNGTLEKQPSLHLEMEKLKSEK
jgi:hypothetical protein